MLKIAVFGAGHLGKIHIKCIQQSDCYNLVGFYDTNPEVGAQVQADFGIPYFSDQDSLMAMADVVDIVTPTIAHYDIAAKAMRKGKHVFIEKPVTATPDEARRLLALSTEAGVKSQIGHVERFNPAFLAIKDSIDTPMFIEAHRLAMFNPRGLDVPVVLDLMIHDIDLILSVVKSTVRKVRASGVAVVSDTPDIANARLEFNNGCVANITTSRISMKNMRKTRFFQNDAYISVDFLEKKAEIVRIKDVDPQTADPMAMIIDLPSDKHKQILFHKPEIQAINAIQTELEQFHHAIIADRMPEVSLLDGTQALEVAFKIMDEIARASRGA